jgi:hypothetical protein
MTEFSVDEGNVLDIASDLLLLKHAQRFYGADSTVAARLIEGRLCSEEEIQPSPGDFAVIETRGVIAPRRVLFVGTPPLRSFTYDEMELFARRAVQKIKDLGLPVRRMTTTIHGTGYGLDGGESLQRLVHGFRRGLSEAPDLEIETITFLTIHKREERMLSAALAAFLHGERPATKPVRHDARKSRTSQPDGASRPGSDRGWSPAPASSLPNSVAKRRVFVAMPYSEEFQNVYEFAIYPAVRNCGFVCERVDEAHFTGDVLERIRRGIESADVVIADLTEGRPNVYLEVGYAWGRGVPVIIVARKGEILHFDVSTHRCLYYGRFTQFANELEKLIRGLEPSFSG